MSALQKRKQESESETSSAKRPKQVRFLTSASRPAHLVACDQTQGQLEAFETGEFPGLLVCNSVLQDPELKAANSQRSQRVR